MRRLGILMTLVALTTGCGASRMPGVAAIATVGAFDALATAKSTAFDDLEVSAAVDDSKACSCSAITATNGKYKIGIQADNGQLQALSVNGKFLVERGAWANSKGKEDVDLTSAQAEEIDSLLTEEKFKTDDKARVASRALMLARIYSGLQKAKADPKARNGFSEAKKALRAFIKANSPDKSKARGQIGV